MSEKLIQSLQIPPVLIQKYERYLPTAFDESLTLLEKVNKMVAFLNLVIEQTNESTGQVVDVLNRFETLRVWLEGEGLEENTDKVLNEWYESGKLEQIINENVFNMKADKTQVDELGSQLAQKAEQQFVEDLGVNVKKHGFIGDGSDTSLLQTIINSCAVGQTIVLPPSGVYLVSSNIILKKGVNLTGYGATIKSTTHTTILDPQGNNVIKGVTLEGNGTSPVNSNGVGIEAKGTKASYRENIVIEDITLKNIGFYGMYFEFAKNVKIKNPTITNVGYSGISTHSSEGISVDKPIIRGVVGSNGLSYGVAFTRPTNQPSLADFPRSKDCTVSNGLFENIPHEAIDSHGGENIKVLYNTIRNCGRGVALVTSRVSEVSVFGCQNSEVRGNTIYGIGLDEGIILSGSETEKSSGCIITGNTLINCGAIGNDITGAIKVEYTNGLIIEGNVLKESREIGINLYRNNTGFLVRGNTIMDTQSASYIAASGISIRSSANTGAITENILLLINSALNTYVSERGIHLANTSADIELVVANNFSKFKTPYHSLDGQRVKYGDINGIQIYTGSGSPEGVITAKRGAIFINRSGGANVSIYIKETGDDTNTGWVGK